MNNEPVETAVIWLSTVLNICTGSGASHLIFLLQKFEFDWIIFSVYFVFHFFMIKVCWYLYNYTHTYIHMYVYVYVCVYVWVCMYVCMYVRYLLLIYICVYTHIYNIYVIYIYIYTYINIYINTMCPLD